MERTLKQARTDTGQNGTTRGMQVVVVHRGREVLNLANGEDGSGRPMRPDTICRVYCAIKPMVAIAAAIAVHDKCLDLDEPLQAHLPVVAGLQGGVTTRHLLTHTAGLHMPTAFQMELVPPPKRRLVIENVHPPSGWLMGQDAAFSEYTGWVILGWLLEVLRDEPLREQLRATVLDPLGLEYTWIGMTAADYKAVSSRLGVSYDLTSEKPMPMLLETSPRWCTEINPAHGGYSTATDLARFYLRLLDWLADGRKRLSDWRQLLRTFTASARPPVHDQTLNRVCPWGLGFMTSLGEHLFGEVCSDVSFGHSGYLGTSFAFADPRHSLVIAVIYNGIVLPDRTASRRIELVRAIYTDLGLGEVGSPPAER